MFCQGPDTGLSPEPTSGGTSKQLVKLQQPKNDNFRVSQFDPPRSRSRNDRVMTTSPPGLRTPRPATEPRDGRTRNFHEKYRKKYPLGRNSGLPEFTPKIPRKYQKNTPKIPKMPVLGIFSVFSGYFLEFQNFGPGGIRSGHLGAL